MRDVSSAHSRVSGNPVAGSPHSRGRADDTLTIAGVTLVADPAGALYWPDEKLLVVADLHLEKGSAFAARGVLLPPYDTATTLGRLARLVERYAAAACDPPPPALLLLYAAYRALLRARLCLAHLLEPTSRAPDQWFPRAQRYVRAAIGAMANL